MDNEDLLHGFGIFTIIATKSFIGLLAIWAAISRKPWLIRTFFVGLIVSIWLFFSEHELFFADLCYFSIPLFGFAFLRSRLEPRESQEGNSSDSLFHRFKNIFYLSNLGLFFSAAMLALLVLILLKITPQLKFEAKTVVNILGVGLVLFFTTAVLFPIRTPIRKSWSRRLLFIFILLNPFTSLIAIWVLLARSAGLVKRLEIVLPSPSGEQDEPIPANPAKGSVWAKLLLVPFSAMLLIPTLLFYGWVLSPHFTPLPGPPVPKENGYMLLTQAAQSLIDLEFDHDELTKQEIREFLLENDDILPLARRGLALPCRIPHEDSLISADFAKTYSLEYEEIGNRQSAFRGIAYLFAAEAEISTKQKKTTQAMESYLDAMRLGVSVSVGGVHIDVINGYGCQQQGIKGLRNILSQLDESQCNELNDQLIELSNRQISPEEVDLSNRTYAWKAGGWAERFVIEKDSVHRRGHYIFLLYRQKIQEFNQLLTVHLAIRRFQLAHSRFPKDLNELTEASQKLLKVKKWSPQRR